ncbi:MAG: FAD-dependent oxidoreductase [Bacilli bacterium]|jgi:thioredoxin reductase (NADPH)
MENNRDIDILIIGAGPAGLTASIYAYRSNLKTLIVSGGAPGGKVNVASKIANFPGYAEIDGASLAFKFYEQVHNMGIEVVSASVLEVRKEGKSFRVITDNGEYFSKAIIVATGTSNKALLIPGEKEFLGKGLSYCATCDGYFFKGRDVAVLGNNSHAFEEALFLANIANKVSLIYAEIPTAEETLIKKVLGTKNIQTFKGYKALSINGENAVASITIANAQKESINVPVSGVFPFIGEKATLDFLHLFEISNRNGFIIVNNLMETNISGVFAAGDVTDSPLRQIVTAASNGAVAATSAIKFVKGLKK